MKKRPRERETKKKTETLPPPGVRGPVGGSPHWYKDAVIYEVRVRSFFDANGDGLGDFEGLAQKLDYLSDLGVTAIWLLPFYPSPLRDDGYDISDYTDVHPQVGTLANFKHFLAEAHRRGLRVITELVLNHTSDQHPWFQRARKAASGTPHRDFYVWSETAERYQDARIIFKDFEPSNWTWDTVAKAYFWHRFYAHQPDLNFENQAVQKALLTVVDFWFKLGVDGLRLDAVPYLYEAEGTNCENLAPTHTFLKKLRRHVDEHFEDRMLLAEANQWPEDAVPYFGDGDECHMAFHFPIMPRIYMSIHMEDRFPLMDIVAQTPAIHPTCQWALFLRNHDELTLEMVTDEERDYMYGAYAREPAMRINLGIRRRLAPLVGGDRRMMELMNGLLFSLLGTPVLYYGDEIGMGDNVYLGDRNGVRTPMQWSPDRNAGFSRANPQRLILPIIIDPDYHYESINVEAQQNNTSSLLWWTKRLIALRKRFKAFGRGSVEFLQPDNPRILAFLRREGDEVILVVANLCRFVQYAQLDLSKLAGLVPVELFGRTKFPPIGVEPYLITLGGHGFYWMSLERARSAESDARTAAYQPPTIEVVRGWDPTAQADDRARLEEALPAWLQTRPWFERWEDPISAVRLVDVLPINGARAAEYLCIAEVEFASGNPERYFLPLTFATGERALELRARWPQSVVFLVRSLSESEADLGVVVDALADYESCRELREAILRRRRWKGASGEVVTALSAPSGPLGAGSSPAPDGLRVIRPESGKPVIVYDDVHVLRIFRRLDDGTSPDLEIGRFLTERAPTVSAAHVLGSIEHRSNGNAAVSEPSTIGILKAFVPHERDAWSHARAELGRYYERVLTRERTLPEARVDGSVVELASRTPPQDVAETIGTYLDAAHLLGQRTAELHLALASEPHDPAFHSEPYSALDQRSRYQSMRNVTGKVLRSLRAGLESIPPQGRRDAETLLANSDRLYERFENLLATKITVTRTRCHGNYHLGQVLYTGKDFVILDFEGDRARPLPERRRKRSPLHDVGGMIRSFHYAAFMTLLDRSVVRDADREAAAPWVEFWHAWTSAQFLRGYLDRAGPAPFVPRGKAELAMLLDAFELEKALLELGGELRRRSEHVLIPLHGLVRMLA